VVEAEDFFALVFFLARVWVSLWLLPQYWVTMSELPPV
jgi:hypothetical protein